MHLVHMQEMRPDFHPVGILLIGIGVVADAATSNYEEREFFRVARPASQPEVVTYASLFGSLWALLALLPTDELPAALAHSMQHRSVLPLLVTSAACGYVSVSFVLLLINLYGATITEMVKSMRKVLTVVVSFLLYPKPVSSKYALGGAAVLISLAATHELQRRKGGDVPTNDDDASAHVLESGSRNGTGAPCRAVTPGAEEKQPLAAAEGKLEGDEDKLDGDADAK